jgi:hypothetical protein
MARIVGGEGKVQRKVEAEIEEQFVGHVSLSKKKSDLLWNKRGEQCLWLLKIPKEFEAQKN